MHVLGDWPSPFTHALHLMRRRPAVARTPAPHSAWITDPRVLRKERERAGRVIGLG